MAARGYAGTSMSVIANETGIPKSAIYHHFGSKAGLLAAVMERGAQGFFDAMTEAHREPPTTGTARDRLEWYFQRTGEVWMHRAEFLRLLILLVMSDEAAEAPEAMATVVKVRKEGRAYLEHMIRSSFIDEGEQIATQVAHELAYVGMVGFDGVFISLQSRDVMPVDELIDYLVTGIAAMGETRSRELHAAPRI
jgi:AcrR family transcriptional regulator